MGVVQRGYEVWRRGFLLTMPGHQAEVAQCQSLKICLNVAQTSVSVAVKTFKPAPVQKDTSQHD